MSHYTIKLHDTVTLTGEIVATPTPVPTPKNPEYTEISVILPEPPTCPDCGNIKIRFDPSSGVSSYEMAGDLAVGGSIFGIGSLSSLALPEVSPNSLRDPGTKGQIAYATGYVYLCIDTDTWVRWPVQQNF